jgi:hypothetical protein
MAKSKKLKLRRKTAGDDPTSTNNPSSTSVQKAGWANPTYAYALDQKYTTTSTAAAQQNYGGYGFNIPSGSTINQLIIKTEAYSNSPSSDILYVWVYDGSVWHQNTTPLALTTSEQEFDWDITNLIQWTPAAVNSIRTRIDYENAGGCFPPAVECLCFSKTQAELEALAGMPADWTDRSPFWNAVFAKTKDTGGDLFKLVRVDRLTEQDTLVFLHALDPESGLPIDRPEIDHKKCEKRISLNIFPEHPKAVVKHTGAFKLIHAYFPIPAHLLRVYAKHEIFRRLLNLPDPIPPEGVLADICITDNHHVWVRNKGVITAGELKVGELVGEIVWDNGFWYTVPLPIVRIDVESFNGSVYDVQFPHTHHILTRYLIGHLSKK